MPLIVVMCAWIIWDNRAYKSFGLLENFLGLLSTYRTKLHKKIQRTDSEGGFVIWTCHLARFWAAFKIREEIPHRGTVKFHSEQVEASRAFYFMAISLRNERVSFGFISKRWVNDPNKNDLRILRKPNIVFSFSRQHVCLHITLSYLCSACVRMDSSRNKQGFGMGMSDPGLVSVLQRLAGLINLAKSSNPVEERSTQLNRTGFIPHLCWTGVTF